MATVAVLTGDRRLGARIHGALRRRHTGVPLPGWSDLEPLLTAGRIHALVFSATREDRPWPDEALPAITSRFPAVGVLYCADPRDGGWAPFHAGALGVDGVSVPAPDLDGEAFLRVLDEVLARALARDVTRRVAGRVDPLMGRCLARAIEAQPRGARASELAAAEGIAIGSLVRRLRNGGHPPPSGILRWSRLFHAGAALDRDDGTVERIAHHLRYSTGAALARALRRDVGHPPTTLIQRGALRCVTEAFLDRETHPRGPRAEA